MANTASYTVTVDTDEFEALVLSVPRTVLADIFANHYEEDLCVLVPKDQPGHFKIEPSELFNSLIEKGHDG